MRYNLSAIAKYCLTSHEQILENLKSAFGQEATNVCHNSIFKTGIILEIADMQSQTSGFTVSNAKWDVVLQCLVLWIQTSNVYAFK